MPIPKKPRPKQPVRRRVSPKRYRFRRAVLLLLVLLGTELAWRTGAFAHTRSHVHARATAAKATDANHAQTSHGQPAAPVDLTSGPPLAGPPVTTPEHAQSTLQRLISLGYPVCRGGGTKPLVALTFDDGPGLYTPKTVDILKQAGARATFFIVAKELIGWPQLADEPKTEATVGAIGDHTYDHIGLDGLSQGNLDHQISDAKSLIEKHSGVTIRLFRPPYGRHDAAVDHEVQGLGMLQVLWSTDSGDSKGATWKEELATVRKGLVPGAIILMHENRGPTLRILPQLLQEIRSKGLHTVTVPELLAADPPTMSQLKSGSCW